MKAEEIKYKDENLDLEYLKGVHKGLLEFVDIIESMEELTGRNLKITFVSGMIGYSCQAIVLKKRKLLFNFNKK